MLIPTSKLVGISKLNIKNDIYYLAKLSGKYKFFIISNQEGVNEGKLEQEFYDETNKKLLSALEEHNIKVEKIYICSHAITENCDCRKPKIGFIEQATKDFQINREKSWIIGDRISDIKLAEAVGMKSVFIQSKLHKIGDSKPNFIALDLCEAVEFIAKNL